MINITQDLKMTLLTEVKEENGYISKLFKMLDGEEEYLIVTNESVTEILEITRFSS